MTKTKSSQRARETASVAVNQPRSPLVKHSLTDKMDPAPTQTEKIDLPLTDSAIITALLGQLKDEDTLLVNRTGWLLAAQSFLLACYFNASDVNVPHELPYCGRHPLDFHVLIGGLGLFSTFAIFAAILASIKVYLEIRRRINSLADRSNGLAFRDLPRRGIGAGLLCPMMLSTGILAVWSLLTFRLWSCTGMMIMSNILFGLYFVVAPQQNLGSHRGRALALTLSVAIMLFFGAIFTNTFKLFFGHKLSITMSIALGLLVQIPFWVRSRVKASLHRISNTARPEH